MSVTPPTYVNYVRYLRYLRYVTVEISSKSQLFITDLRPSAVDLPFLCSRQIKHVLSVCIVQSKLVLQHMAVLLRHLVGLYHVYIHGVYYTNAYL